MGKLFSEHSLVQQGRNNDPVLPSIDSSMQNLGKATTAWGFQPQAVADLPNTIFL
jgi:hypothetical protein